MVNEGKIAGMWRGNLVNVIKTAPENVKKSLLKTELFHIFIFNSNSRPFVLPLMRDLKRFLDQKVIAHSARR